MVPSEHSPEHHDDEQCSLGMSWQGKNCYCHDVLFIPQIYELMDSAAHLPTGFNAALLKLDGRLQSTMDWENSCIQARNHIAQGIKILWMLDLGLFSAMPYELLNQTQMQSLILSIDHFSEAVWGEFGSDSLGVCLYVGSLLELYEVDARMEYLDILAQCLPADVECFVLVDAKGITSPSMEASFCSRERSNRIRFIVKNSLLPAQDLAWGIGSPYGYVGTELEDVTTLENRPIGLCLPEIEREHKGRLAALDEAAAFLSLHKISYRIVHEAYLTTEWECLDFLIVCSDDFSPIGKRMLQGFCAAGGSVLTIGSFIGVAQEISFDEWKQSIMMKP